jgi:hypothetical protein
MRLAGLGGRPAVDQARPLRRAPDQRRPFQRLRPLGGGGGLVVARQQRLVRRPGRRRRLHTELALQRRGAGVVDAQGSRPVAAGVVQPHQRPVGLLVQRVVAQQPLRVADRAAGVAARLQQRGDALQRVEVAGPQPLALAQQPLVVASLEEVAAIQLDRLA